MQFSKDLVGRQVVTEQGDGVVLSVIRWLNLLHVGYPDGSIGWLKEGQFTFKV